MKRINELHGLHHWILAMAMVATAPSGSEVLGRDVDTFWRGVKMGLEPHLVPEGFASEAVNMRFVNGVPESRLGPVKIAWMNKIVGGTVQPWGVVLGKPGNFREPETKVEYTLIAADGGVYACRANNAPLAVGLPAGVTLTGTVSFVSAPEAIVLLRGEAGAPLVMTSLVEGFKAATKIDSWAVTIDVLGNRVFLADHFFNELDPIVFSGTVAPAGLTLGTKYFVRTVLDSDYFTVSATEDGAEVDFTGAGVGVAVSAIDGTGPMPPGQYGFHAANRLFVLLGEIIYASDILDYTRHLKYEGLRIQQGGAEDLIAARVYGEETVIALKRHSVAKVTGVTGQFENLRQSAVTGLYGSVSPLTGQDVGTDFLWLSEHGVASLTLTVLNQIQATEGGSERRAMFSTDIQPLIDRINWQYASGACDEYWEQKYYLAVPLDRGEVFGPELLANNGGKYPPGPPFTATVSVVNLTVGATYRWVMGANEVSLANGTQTLATGGDFVAQGTSITITGTAFSALVTASLKRALVGVNNAVLVYSFRNQAWAGHDEADAFAVKYLFTAEYLGKKRLYFVSEDGFVNLYEEDFEDQLTTPYADVVVSAAPANGNTFRVNGGTTILALASANNIDPTTWGAGSPASVAIASRNLWDDLTGAGGYNPSTAAWSAPNTEAVPITNGVRFYGSNGVLPAAVMTGTWGTVTYHVSAPVVARFVSRGYEDSEGTGLKARWLNCYLETWDPSLDFELVQEGANAIRSLKAGVTRDGAKWWKPFDRADRDGTNVNGDALDPHRKDYSEPGTGDVAEGAGVNGDLMQESVETFKLTGRVRMAQLAVTCRQGRMRIMRCGVEGKAGGVRGGSRSN